MHTKKTLIFYFSKTLVISLTLLLVLLSAYSDVDKLASKQELKTSFSKIFIFGDSLSDNGNLWRTSSRLLPPGGFPESPPYYAGRFSNYKVWSEMLSDYLKAPEFNYAYGGARITKSIIFYPIPTITQQIDAYINSTASGDPDALYIIWAGANDITMSTNFNLENDLPNKMLTLLNYNINRLLNHGAKKFLLLPVPYLSATPNALRKAQSDKHYLAKLDYIVQRYNQGFYHLISNYITYSKNYQLDLKFISLDAYGFLKDAINEAGEYGFTNVTEACNPNSYAQIDAVPKKPVCYNPEQYLFWDGTHPTYRTHYLLTNLIINQIENAGYKANEILLEPSTEDLYSHYIATQELDKELFGGEPFNKIMIKFYIYLMKNSDVAFY